MLFSIDSLLKSGSSLPRMYLRRRYSDTSETRCISEHWTCTNRSTARARRSACDLAYTSILSRWSKTAAVALGALNVPAGESSKTGVLPQTKTPPISTPIPTIYTHGQEIPRDKHARNCASVLGHGRVRPRFVSTTMMRIIVPPTIPLVID